MAIKIAFDSSHNVIPPTLVLTTRNGNKLGGLLYHDLVVKHSIRQSMEMSFSITKNDYCDNNHNAGLWNLISDFKLVWCKEWNCYFEINVTTDEEYSTRKEITAVSLGDAELSQIYLYNIQINTEEDIARDDYEPTTLYNENNANASLLHRIMEKVPHYTIKYVDPAVAGIQRTFSFDNKSLYDAFQEIAEEIECVFDIMCLNSTDGIERNIYIYGLENYGKDTNILLTTDVLADNINYSIDTGAVKNCFRLEGGDDLMTATVRNCNPNGSGYIWYISKELESDMSDELVEKLKSYNTFYDYYQNKYDPFNPATDDLPPSDAVKVKAELPNNPILIKKYNDLVDKYSVYSDKYQKIAEPMIGYPTIMEGYYNTVDFYYYLNNNLMPTVQMSDTSAQAEASKLHAQSLNNTAVQNLSSTTSVATVNSAIAANAKAIIDTRYQINVLDEDCSFTYSEQTSIWNGKIKVTNYSDEEDTYTVTLTNIIISGDYTRFVRQKLETVLANTRTDTVADIVDLFKLNDTRFKEELKKYSLQRLKAFHDACQGCIDVLIQQGVADDNNTESEMYVAIYLPYYSKLGFIQSEMDLRQKELEVVVGKFDSEGGLLTDGVQTILEKERNTIQTNLSFQDYLGAALWQEFVAYRREDTYSNANYVSDGLGNDELFAKAMEFIQTAKDEIEESATKQHTINARLKNLLVMKEFEVIVDCFEIGNWLRLRVDDKLFKLRLVSYQIDFESLESIDITFSDIVVDGTEATAKDILNQAASMATSYNTVSRQARRGDKASLVVNDFVNDGLALTTTKIVDTADNQEVSWDKHGLVCREYDGVSNVYKDTQVKLINKGVYITDNNWLTAKAGIGNFTFFNPAEGEYQEAYGVIADTLVGNLILGKSVGIYNTKNSITMDENGFVLTTDGTGSEDSQPVFTIRRKTINSGTDYFKDMVYIDSNGFVTINGGVKIEVDGESDNSTMVEMIDGKIATHITDELGNGGIIRSAVTQTANEIKSTVSSAMNKYNLEDFTFPVELFGFGSPDSDVYPPSQYYGVYYLDQNNGDIYYSVGAVWAKTIYKADLITDELSSEITQSADSVEIKVASKLYGTSGMKLDEASLNVTADSIVGRVSQTETDISNRYTKTETNSQISQSANEIKSTVSKSTSKYDTTGYTITISGYGAPTASPNNFAPSSYNGKYYLDQSNGKLYLSNGSSWNNVKTLNLITDNLNSQITQTADQIKMSVSSSVSQYDLSSFSGVISVFGYGDPTTSNPAASSYNNQYYLNQSNGQVYKSNGSSWSTFGSPLSVLSGSWQSQITANANAITSKVGTADVHTIIQQTPEDVRIAWNGISNYISFADSSLNIYDNTSQDVAHLLMKLNSDGLSYYDYDSSAIFSIQVLGTPTSTGYSPSAYAGKYYQDLSNGDAYLSDGVKWRKVDALGSKINMKTDRNGAYYYYEGKRLGKIGTNTLGKDHTNKAINGLVFDLDPYAQYMTWAARTNTTDNYSIKFTYFQNDITTMNGDVFKQGFRVSADTYFRNAVDFNSTVAFNGTVSFNNSIASDVQMNNNKLYLDTYSYIMADNTGKLDMVGRTDKALTITGHSGKNISIGAGGVSINTDLIVAGTVTSGSDARLKTNIKDSTINTLSRLSSIELKEFDWISDKTHSSVGIIAQQLQETIPELVQENVDTGMLSIKVDRFIPFLVKSIQELYSLCGGKKKLDNQNWVDIYSDAEKKEFYSSIKESIQNFGGWTPPSKSIQQDDEILLINR